MAFRDGILVFSQPGALPPRALEQVIERRARAWTWTTCADRSRKLKQRSNPRTRDKGPTAERARWHSRHWRRVMAGRAVFEARNAVVGA